MAFQDCRITMQTLVQPVATVSSLCAHTTQSCKHTTDGVPSPNCTKLESIPSVSMGGTQMMVVAAVWSDSVVAMPVPSFGHDEWMEVGCSIVQTVCHLSGLHCVSGGLRIP